MTTMSDVTPGLPEGFPVIVCLCGSTRFPDAFTKASRDETLAGKIVLSVGLFGRQEATDMGGPVEAMLDELHLRKIDLADEVLVLNCKRLFCPCCESWGGQAGPRPAVREGTHCGCPTPNVERPYVGESTRREITYALSKNKRVTYLNPPEV